VLNLKGCTEITNDGLKYLADLPLKHLSMQYTGLKDKPMPALSAIKSLDFLDLRNTDIGDEASRYIFPLENLRYLNVSDTKIKHLKYLLNTLSHRLGVENLFLDRCPVGGELPILAGSNVKVLSIVGVSNLTAADFDTIASLPHLGSLDCNNTNITDKQLMRLVNTQLGEIKIAYCPNLHREVVREFIRKKPIKVYSDWWSEPHIRDFLPTKGPDLIANGSFDVPGAKETYVPMGAGDSRLRGWRITQGCINVMPEKYCMPADGKFSVELSQTDRQPGVLEQDLQTVPGADYVVSYYAAPHYVTDAKKAEFRISAGNNSAVPLIDHDPRQKKDAMYWQHLQFPFKATANVTTLTFANGNLEEKYGACISNVRVYRVK